MACLLAGYVLEGRRGFNKMGDKEVDMIEGVLQNNTESKIYIIPIHSKHKSR